MVISAPSKFFTCAYLVYKSVEMENKKFKGIKQNETKIILDKGIEGSLKNKEDMKQMQKID